MPDRQFGRIPSTPDPKDWILDNFDTQPLRIRRFAKWDFPCKPLDQSATNHCVGFGIAHFGINLPTFTPYTKEEAHELYYKCKVKDGEPGAENGTTIRSAAQVLQDIGAINHYAFARDVDSIRRWLLNHGPLIIGIIWTEGMMTPDKDGKLSINGFIVGGHCCIINEITEDNYFGIKNSWGENWGINGKAYISVEDFEKIFYYGGEALAAVEKENYKIQKTNWFTKLIDFIKSLFNERRDLFAP